MLPVAGATAAGAPAGSRQRGATPRGAGLSHRLVIALPFVHGDLASFFPTPSTNRRSGRFGNRPENRLRSPLMLRRALREAVSDSVPATARVPCTNWIVASASQTEPQSRPKAGTLWQLRFARRIRREAAIQSVAMGCITEATQAKDIGRRGARHWSHALGAPLPSPPTYAYGGHFARRHVPAHRNAEGRSLS